MRHRSLREIVPRLPQALGGTTSARAAACKHRQDEPSTTASGGARAGHAPERGTQTDELRGRGSPPHRPGEPFSAACSTLVLAPGLTEHG